MSATPSPSAQSGSAHSGLPGLPGGRPLVPLRPWAGRHRNRRRVLAPVVLIVVMAALMTPLIGLTVLGAGPEPAALGTLFAFLPVVPVVAVFLWIDRWEPEPGRLLLMAFLWGAGVAALAAAISNFALNYAWSRTVGTELGDVVSTVVTAPFVEEAVKGAFLFVLLATRRREVDGVVDGIVYAGLVGVGFAFSENILYLGTAIAEGGLQGGIMLFALRCVLSPFAHPIFTAMTGLAVGIMARSRRRIRFVYPLAGYLAAVCLHGLWNASASLLGQFGFFLVYAVFMVPVFAAMAMVVLWQRRREQRIVAGQLPRFVAANWIAPGEVRLLSSLAGRSGWRSAVKRRWGAEAARAVRDYHTAVTELAFFYDRYQRGAIGYDADHWRDDLITKVLEARERAVLHPRAMATAEEVSGPPPAHRAPEPIS
ncbi:PrsW family intramembrane metalloprotease [Actinopolymorpha sp. NPDC004070]|uniref:PrsW family intramembrane metalloprotease n=1 Tax=Actinopolymorpha sp. NPDC004070 TaxID=3154548 RepID=UPI0033BD125A